MTRAECALPRSKWKYLLMLVAPFVVSWDG